MRSGRISIPFSSHISSPHTVTGPLAASAITLHFRFGALYLLITLSTAAKTSISHSFSRNLFGFVVSTKVSMENLIFKLKQELDVNKIIINLIARIITFGPSVMVAF
jgi:hypothetical protein